MTILLQTIALTGMLVCTLALTPKASAQTSPLATEKVEAKKAAVAAHAAKKRACKTEAKNHGVRLGRRHAYVRDCMKR